MILNASTEIITSTVSLQSDDRTSCPVAALGLPSINPTQASWSCSLSSSFPASLQACFKAARLQCVQDGSEHHCDLLVVADGANSKVRASLLPSEQPHYEGVLIMAVRAPLEPYTGLVFCQSSCFKRY